MQSHRQLVEACLQGRSGAFAHLTERYRYALYKLCLSYTQDFDATEDMVQETLITAYLKMQDLSDPDQFGTWLRRIATNNCHRWSRYRNRHRSVNGDEEMPLVTPDRSPEDEFLFHSTMPQF